MNRKELTYKNSQISYYRFGSGPGLALCFHGYGEDGSMYQFFEKYAGDRFTLYAIDLPFHGNTTWKEGLNFTHTDLQQIIHDILLENDVIFNKEGSAPKLSLIGFSLGGRIALSLYQAWPGIIEKLVLLAPDGLKVNFWYRLATRTWAGKKLFALTMKYPGWFFGLLRLLNKLKLVNSSIFKFVSYYIGNTTARRQLYERWITLRRLKPKRKHIKAFIRQNKTPVELIYGQHDRIILPIRGEKFREGIEEYCKLSVINSGHNVLNEKHAERLTEALLSSE